MRETPENTFYNKRTIWSSIYLFGEEDFQSGLSMFAIYINKANLMEETVHSHDFDIYLVFCDSDPDNMNDVGAEIELSFGEKRKNTLSQNQLLSLFRKN